MVTPRKSSGTRQRATLRRTLLLLGLAVLASLGIVGWEYPELSQVCGGLVGEFLVALVLARMVA